MLKSLILALAYSVVAPGTWSHPVAVIELNAYYGAKGEFVYEQLILWDRNPATGHMEVRQWGLVGEGHNPYPYTINGVWHCSVGGIKARSSIYRESYTQTDPERDNQRLVPQTERFVLPKEVR